MFVRKSGMWWKDHYISYVSLHFSNMACCGMWLWVCLSLCCCKNPFLATIINRSILCAVCELRTWLKEMFCLTQQKKSNNNSRFRKTTRFERKKSKLHKNYFEYNICMHENRVVDSGISSFFKYKLQLCFINFLVSHWF